MDSSNDSGPSRPAGGLRRILVASDLTPYSDRALDRALMLAEQNGAAVRFVHAVAPTGLPESYVERDLRDAQAQLEREIRDAGIGNNVAASIKVLSGNPEAVIIDEAAALPADVIVMGVSQDASLLGVVRGTVIDKVVRRAQCPVLVVKRRARRPYAKIAAAIDLAEPSRRALDVALREFPDAEITILHVDEAGPAAADPGTSDAAARAERQHQIEDRVVARCLAAGRSGPGSSDGPTVIFASGVAVNVLQDQILRLDPDLVVLGTHGRTGVSSLFIGSVAETLLEVLRQDVLVVRG
jgi:nucleotide-binding universal stress UspA family protein